MSRRASILPRTIAGQITALVVAAVLLGVGLSMASFVVFQSGSGGKNGVDALTAQIATVTLLARSARSQGELAALLDLAHRSGIAVSEAAPSELISLRAQSSMADNLAARLLAADLHRIHGIKLLQPFVVRGASGLVVGVSLNEGKDLVFASSTDVAAVLPRLILVAATFAASIIALFLAFLSVYAIRWITRPLSSIAAAARAFGRSSSDEPLLSETGPREISQVAHTLNDMRARIRSLMEDRMRMLVAISHDLRTPLTRLRLRAERVPTGITRDSMLQDISRIDDMLRETLTYLREGAHREQFQGVDLPSILQTVCAEFADLGRKVRYDGPRRLGVECRPGSIARMITNLVENGLKHGTSVAVALREDTDERIEIDVSDDGPGVPVILRQKVFEPFFKADSARSSAGRGGFGLGLSIVRDIVTAHRGTIDLLDGTARGLIVRLVLPRRQNAATASGMISTKS